MDQPSRARRPGVVAVAVVAAVAIGAVVGWVVGVRSGPSVVDVASAGPIPAVSPSVPVFVPYSPDVRYPPLATHLSYVTRTIGQKPFRWKYRAPKGWVPQALGSNEIRWEPAGEPYGGYFLRVKLVSSHLTPPQMVKQKYDALNACCQDVSLIQREWNTVGVTYRDPTANIKRWDIFRWLTPAGSGVAGFEMSVGGRGVDDPGLQDLLTQVSASVHEVG